MGRSGLEDDRDVLREGDACLERVDPTAAPVSDADGVQSVASECTNHRAPVELVPCKRMLDGAEVGADLVAQSFVDPGFHERPRPRSLEDFVAGARRTRLVAHDVARVDARLHATLILWMVRERKLDRALVWKPLLAAEEQVALVEPALLERSL